MWKLLKNYSKYNRHNLAQSICLNFLVFVMVIFSLALLFSNQFVKNQILCISHKSNITTPIYRAPVQWDRETRRLFPNSDSKYFLKNAYFLLHGNLKSDKELNEDLFPNLLYTYLDHNLDEYLPSINIDPGTRKIINNLPDEIKRATISISPSNSDKKIGNKFIGWNFFSCGYLGSDPNTSVTVGCNTNVAPGDLSKAKPTKFSDIFNIKDIIGNSSPADPYSMHQISKFEYQDQLGSDHHASYFFSMSELYSFINQFNNHKYYFITSNRAESIYHKWLMGQLTDGKMSQNDINQQLKWENEQVSRILYWTILTGLFISPTQNSPAYQISNNFAINDPINQQKTIKYEIYGFNARNNKLTDLYNRPVLMKNCYDGNNCGKISDGFKNINFGTPRPEPIPIFITEYYAKINHLKVGSIIHLYNFDLKIVAFVTSSLTSYLPMQGSKQFTAIWMNNHNANGFYQNVLQLNKSNITPTIFGFQQGSNQNKEILKQYSLRKLWSPIVNINQSSISTNPFVATKVKNRLMSQEQAAIFLIILILILCILIVLIVVINVIQDAKQVIGVLKSNGYGSLQISAAISLSFSWPVIISSIIGASLSGLVGYMITKTFIPFSSFLSINIYYNSLYVILAIILPVLLIWFFSFLLTQFFNRKPALSMLYNLKSNLFQNLQIALLKPIKFLNYRAKMTLTLAVTNLQTTFLVLVSAVIGSVAIIFSFFAFQVTSLIKSQLFLNEKAAYIYNYVSDNNIYNNLKPISNQQNKQKNFNDKFKYLYTTRQISDVNELNNSNSDNLFTMLRNISSTGSFLNASIYKTWFRGNQASKYYKEVVTQRDCSKIMPHFPISQSQCDGLANIISNNGAFEKSYFDTHPNLIVDIGQMLYIKSSELPYISLPVNVGASNLKVSQTPKKCSQTIQKCKITNFQDIPFTAFNYNITATDSNYLKYISHSLSTSELTNFLNSDKISKLSSNYSFLSAEKYNQRYLEPQINEHVVYLPIIISRQLMNYANLHTGDSLYLSNSGFHVKIIGIVYDVDTKIDSNTILISKNIFSNIVSKYISNSLPPDSKDNYLNYANNKLSLISTNEFNRFVTIINNNRNYSLFKLTKDVSGYDVAIKNLTSIVGSKEYYNTTVAGIGLILSFTTILTAAIAVIIVFIGCNLLLKANYKSILFFKSLGMSTWHRLSNFIFLYIPMSIIGFVLAALIMPMISGAFVRIFTMILNTTIIVRLPIWVYILSAIILLIAFTIFFVIVWKVIFFKKPLYRA